MKRVEGKAKRWHTSVSDVLVTTGGICVALALVREKFPLTMPYEAYVVFALFIFGGSIGVLLLGRARGVRKAFMIGGIRFILMCCLIGFLLPSLPDEDECHE